MLTYRKAYHSAIIFSIALSILLLIVQFLFLPFTLSAFLLMIFLCMENRTEWKHRYFVFVRFLLNRYEGKSAIRVVRRVRVQAQTSLMQVFTLFIRNNNHHVIINST